MVHALAWSLATGAAVTLSWWGVHTVLSGTVYDPPRALPAPLWAADGTHDPDGRPLTSSTRYPGPGGPSASTAPETSPSGDPTAPATPSTTPPRRPDPTTRAPAKSPSAPAPPTSDANSGSGSGSGSNVKSYAVDGGRVAFDLGETSAELVSATPAPGWQMQVWKQTTWIRVTFTQDGRELSVFCVWHDTAPRVEIDDRAV
ncbi:hypothetical protein ADL06_03090 [Streptomyces sp. NRRL F-6491]|nr:hypothetical protein ADL06_03090 [Streptomyces sp. NRRL F-6491]KOX46692.1 hypothetical protein ADL08_12800 [Streptomyces sp. NRRL F-6492]